VTRWRCGLRWNFHRSSPIFIEVGLVNLRPIFWATPQPRQRVKCLPFRRGKPIDQCQTVKTFAESAREIIDPALAAQSAPLPDLFHRHAENQDLMHQRGAVGAEFALGAVQPQHGLALAFRNRLPRPPAIDIFPRGIDRLRTALGFLPIALKGPPALVLRFVDLTMRVQPP
jgi:hypothetical protein